MQIHVKGGVPYDFKARGYTSLKPVYGTMECVRYAKEQLEQRKKHLLSVLELKHDMSPDISETNVHSHSSIYIILDGTTKELMILDGAAKGYAGEGPRGALALDTYLDSLNIPLYRRLFSREMIQRVESEKVVKSPRPKLPRFSLNKMDRIKRRAKVACLELVPPFSFDKLHENMSLEEMLEAVDFHQHGYYV